MTVGIRRRRLASGGRVSGRNAQTQARPIAAIAARPMNAIGLPNRSLR